MPLEKTSKPNKMAVMPMGRLVFSLSLPIMISMLVQALYNVVDSLYVSHIADTPAVLHASDKAVQALTLAFPIQMLMTAVSVGTGVGVSAILSRYLGQKNRSGASRVAGNAVFLAGLYYLAFLIFGLVGAAPFVAGQTTDPVTAGFATSYLKICTTASFGSMFYFAYEKVLQATGKSTLAMLVQMSGAIANIILDPFFIYGWWGLPELGVTGAAIATVLGQCLSLVIGIFVHYRYNDLVDHELHYLRPDFAIIRKIYAIGLPAIVMSAMTSVMSYGMNMLLGAVSASLVTAFGIYFKLQNFIYMPAFGLNNALVPIAGFSYGAKSKERLKAALRWGLLFVSIIMGSGILLLQGLAAPIASLFAVSAETLSVTVQALKIISFGYLFAGANIILQGFCQALGNGVYSLLISLLRMALLLLPLVWLLIKTGHTSLVWIAFPLAEAVSLLFAVYVTRKLARKRFKEIA